MTAQGQRWEKQPNGAWWAYSGKLVVGMVVQRPSRRWAWSIDIPSAKRLGATEGERMDLASCRRMVDLAFQRWLEHADLQPKDWKE